MENTLNSIFVSKFDLNKLNFSDLVVFTDATVKLGFTARKKFRENDNGYFSFFTIYVSNEEFNKTTDAKKFLNIKLGYGKAVDGGYQIRQDIKLLDPIDVSFPNEYCYDIVSGEFFHKNKKINPNKLLEDVYTKHIKSTKIIAGLYVRSIIWFYRTFLNLFFKSVSKIFSFFVVLVSGDVYKYGFSEHIDKMLNREKRPRQDDPITKSSERVSFLGYTATPSCIMFYSVFHFVIFGVLYKLDLKPVLIETIFKNGFLTLIYVMVSLIFIDKILPKLFKKIVDASFELSMYFSYKTIKF